MSACAAPRGNIQSSLVSRSDAGHPVPLILEYMAGLIIEFSPSEGGVAMEAPTIPYLGIRTMLPELFTRCLRVESKLPVQELSDHGGVRCNPELLSRHATYSHLQTSSTDCGKESVNPIRVRLRNAPFSGKIKLAKSSACRAAWQHQLLITPPTY